MILLNDILDFTEAEIKNTKIRFNKGNEQYNPIELFKQNNARLYEGHFWNYTNKSYKEGQIAIGFINLEDDKWLLFDISKIEKDLNVKHGPGYEYSCLRQYEKYFGRLIIKYKNKSQNLIRLAETVIEDCEVFEIISDTYEDDLFPGYDNINISWEKLGFVIDKKDWKAALINQKGVYLITDTLSGKKYVGSAYGDDMLYGRLKNYVETCHGGNRDLKKLNSDYIKKYFRYSILEIYKSTTDDKLIINREHYWMNVLLTRDKRFGYNN